MRTNMKPDVMTSIVEMVKAAQVHLLTNTGRIKRAVTAQTSMVKPTVKTKPQSIGSEYGTRTEVNCDNKAANSFAS